MKKSSVPNLTRLLHKNVDVRLGGDRSFRGKLVGYDAFMNLVLADVACPGSTAPLVVLRGDSIEMIDSSAK
jgi:small nuclear ribonucleoprotein (snRNP)-like protein